MVLAITNVAPGFRALPLSIQQLCLSSALKCGQSFRWSAFPLEGQPGTLPSHEYRLCLRDRVVCLRQTADTLYYRAEYAPGAADVSQKEVREAETLSWIRDYFQLDIDLLDLYAKWSAGDPIIAKLRARFEGIRVLRQDPFECLISFICSSNNNISRITNMVNALCKQFSPRLISLPPPDVPNSHEETYHPFPPPSALASPEVAKTLRTLGFGYRAEFIQKTAQMLVERHGSSGLSKSCPEPVEVWLTTLRDMSTAEAREELLKLMGVGRKVADCVLLMSLDKPDVVPIDTHVHQIAIKHYGLSTSGSKTAMSSKLYEQLTTKFAKVWGSYAGWAHVVLFTSDLKAFSIDVAVTPSASSPTKRKRAKPLIKASEDEKTPPVAEQIPTVAEEDGSLAERVKRRRRGALSR